MENKNKYLNSLAFEATAQTMKLAATVIGFDVVELWANDSGYCTYVHAADHIIDRYPDLAIGLYPEGREHRLSPRLCALAKNSPNGYYWHTVEEGEPRITCFGTTAQTEIAFMLRGDEGHFDMFIVSLRWIYSLLFIQHR